ncbi:CoA pyrophosphatase [Mesorhizobium sp. RP14(2022)]|uniref:CoA pyrophosphatase n=1 Tax=Mesorhizobium liriopis TaxID=2953882 RepID=A0ABT1C4T3_9HYPH|nr:CoA pyrophosphatase [Mesorhizobium liriopis]
MDAPVLQNFSAADFRARGRAHVISQTDEPNHWGDHRWNPGAEALFPTDDLREAAVLIAVVDRGPQSSLILTKRTETLRDHSGQIALPGGRIDPGDGSPEAAALREAQEEVGLAPSRVEVVGRLPDYVSGSGYRIAPVLGIVRPPVELVLNPTEVEAAFEVPLSFLMSPANHKVESRIWKERERLFYVMHFEERRIWGITAGILRMLYERLYA